jgi:hypothetical protein
MAQSALRFIRRSGEYLNRQEIPHLKKGLRGIYVLYDKCGTDRYDVRYVGMSAGNRLAIKGRLRSHEKSKRKGKKWSHFSVFQVWDNVTDQEIAELEGFARHIYRKDKIASGLNIRRGYKKLGSKSGVRNNNIRNWD